MDLEHEFVVPTSIADAWAALADVPTVARCMPGAALDDETDTPYTGTITVKVGAITIKFKGEATITARDDSQHRLELSCKGVDVRGASTADALIGMQLADLGSNSTRVTVTTKVQLSGRVAQFGRGMLQSVSDTILRKFVTNLESELGLQTSEQETEQSAGSSSTKGGGVSGFAPRRDSTPASQGDDVIDLGAAALPALWEKYGPMAISAIALAISLRAIMRDRPTCSRCGRKIR